MPALAVSRSVSIRRDPCVLVMGGSQGASGINELIRSALPVLARHALDWQWLHLTGPQDVDKA